MGILTYRYFLKSFYNSTQGNKFYIKTKLIKNFFFQVFWSYIVGMLTNLESMSLDRIHQMLKMFVSEGPTSMECSIQELRFFLEGKVREHKLIVSGGVYKLPKN